MKKSDRPHPDLLSKQETTELLKVAENLWSDLQKNDLGGFSGINRPFYILNSFKDMIEKYGRRDVGLTWSANDIVKSKNKCPHTRVISDPCTSSVECVDCGSSL